MRFVAVVGALVLAGLTSQVWASGNCRVTDPTGTPLNIRTSPNGPIVGAAENGVSVTLADVVLDRNGKAWAFIQKGSDGQPLGWVFRKFVTCF